MKKLLLFSVCFFALHVSAQEMLGIRNSNYAGLTGLGLNPSSIADSRLRVDISLLNFGITFENDYLFIPEKNLSFLGFGNVVDRVEAKEYLDDFLRGEADLKNLFVEAGIMGPGLMFTGKKNHAIAFHWGVRAAASINGIVSEGARYAFTEWKDSTLYGVVSGQNINPVYLGEEFKVNAAGWQEYVLSYAGILKDKDRHFIKGGISVKYLAGVYAGYVRNPSILFQAIDDTTLVFGPSSFEYGRVSYNTFDKKAEDGERTVNGGGFGWDLGFAYEWRHKPEKYMYEMDGEKRNDNQKNKYILRVGASLIDMGQIKYRKNSKVFNIESDSLQYYPLYHVDEFKSQLDYDSSISSIFYGVSGSGGGPFLGDYYDVGPRSESFKSAKESFIIGLPSAWSIQLDWNVYDRFYLNSTLIKGFSHSKNPGIDRADIISFTPRYESKWLDIAVPFSIINYEESQARLGLAFRVGSVYFGSDKIGTAFGLGDLYGMDVYAGLKFSLLQEKPSDRDNDKVSDAKDKCPDVPGLLAFNGCPDRDGDGVQDSEDQCPDVPGLSQFAGCPDRDADGIIDGKDDCPDQPGVPAFNGCPDTDSDGIQDSKDECPTLAGLPEYNGCPDTDKDSIPDPKDECPTDKGLREFNGCPDSDGDGIPNPKDKCPYEVGPLANEGCPVKVTKVETKAPEPVKIEITEEEKAILKKVFDNLLFETGKSIIKTSSYASLDELAELLKKKPAYRLTIDGHTDNQGGASMNMKLSQNRAKAAKDYLIKKGVDASRIISTGYGLTRPVATNATAEGRQKNRRVEFNIVE